MAEVHRVAVISNPRKLALEAVHVMDSIVDTDANRYRCNCNRHNIQRNADPAHYAQHEGCGDRVRDNADQRDHKGSKQDQKHQHDRQHHDTQRQYLRLKKALQHIVVHDKYASQLNILIGKAKI